MFKLDNALLEELGLGSLPATEKNKMLAHIYETLEMRVGMQLASQMTNEQLDEFESFIDRNDDAGALKWLESNFPGYKQVVADELEKLKTEIKTAAPQILAASQPAGQISQAAPNVPPLASTQPPAMPSQNPSFDSPQSPPPATPPTSI